MKRIIMKTMFFISIILSVQFLFLNIYLVRAEDDIDQEEIIILDDSKINVVNAKHFIIGDINADQRAEVVTFKSKVKDSGAQWIINAYHVDDNIWFPVLSKIISENVAGHIYKVDVGNFDNDAAQEIIIASWENDGSKIYLLEYNKRINEFKIQIIYELSSRISDLEVHSNVGENFDNIYILFSDNTDSVVYFETNVIIIDRDENGVFNSELIYSESKIYWSLFTIGQFIEQESHENQILLYQYKTTESIMREAIVRIITSDGNVIMDDTNIGMYSTIRDIVAWDRNKGGTDELCILEIDNMGDDIGFTSKMIYCTFNRNGLLEKEDRLINSNKILNQLGIGKIDDQDDKLLILDPILGSVTYARFFDEEARYWYGYWGYCSINSDFDEFKDMYELDLDILVSSSGDFDYDSSGSTTEQLMFDFMNQVTMPNYGADIAIAVCRDVHSDWWIVGRGEWPGRRSIIFTDYGSDIICHEVGHNYELYTSTTWHCPNPWCIMTAIWTPGVWDFCDNCENYIDKEEFGSPPPPPGGGGCPILYTFNGAEYIEEGLLDIHDIDGIDRTYIHTLQTVPFPLNHKINLQLIEHPKTISDIDHVRLYGRLENGQWVSLRLKSAIHSSMGEVRKLLQYSDDLRVTELGEEYNNGISEFINLEFHMNRETDFLEFIFIIEGNNMIIK